MKNVIEILDRYYQSFINQQRDWDFFLGLADYVKYAVETPDIDNILKRIVQARDNDQKRLKKYEQEVIKETKEAKEKLFKIIKKHKISGEALDRAIEEYQGYENGTTLSSQSRGEALSGALIAIIYILFKKGYKELMKDFVIEHKKMPDEVGKYIFSKTLESYEKEKEIFNEKLKTELWASWNNLVLAYLTVFKANEELEKLRKDEKDFFKAWNFMGLVGEMRKIRDGNINGLTGIASDFEPIHFKKENYISHATRIHNYLIWELDKEEAKKPIKETALYLNQNGELYREPKDKYCYPMGEKSNRHRIIRFLVTNKGYQLTEFISTELGIESEKTIRTGIGKMRNNIEKYLEIKGKDFFQGKKESGYRINPKYKVIPKNE